MRTQTPIKSLSRVRVIALGIFVLMAITPSILPAHQRPRESGQETPADDNSIYISIGGGPMAKLYFATWDLPRDPPTGYLAYVKKTLYVWLGDSNWHEVRGYRYVKGQRVLYVAGKPLGECDAEGYTVLSNNRRAYQCREGTWIGIHGGVRSKGGYR